MCNVAAQSAAQRRSDFVGWRWQVEESLTPDSGTEESSPLLGAGPDGWNFFTALIETMPVVPYIDAPDENLTLYIGPQSREILGLDRGDIVNPHFDQTIDHVHPDDRDHAIAETHRLMDIGGGRQEWRFIRPDTGETIWIEERLSVVEVDGRRLSPGVLIDITSQKRSAAEIAAHVQALEKIDEISRTFTDLVVSSGDVTEILRKLADIVDGSVVLSDVAGVDTVSEGTTRGDGQLLEHEVVVRGERWGTLRVYCGHEPGRVEAVAVDRATAAVALALLVEREASLVAETARAALINDLVMERITSGRELRRRARTLGTDLGRDPLRVLIVEPLPPQKGGARARARVRDSAAARTTKVLDASGCRALVAPEGERVVAVVALPATVDSAQVCSALRHPDCRAGFSTMVDDHDVLRAYHQAVDSVRHAAERLPGGGAGAVVPFDDLGLSVLLDRLAEGPELGRFFEAELGPLLEHDRMHGSSLVVTLQALLAENGSKTAAAQRLGVERRTIYYRVERITEILGRDLANPETRLRLELAVRAWESLDASDRRH